MSEIMSSPASVAAPTQAEGQGKSWVPKKANEVNPSAVLSASVAAPTQAKGQGKSREGPKKALSAQEQWEEEQRRLVENEVAQLPINDVRS